MSVLIRTRTWRKCDEAYSFGRRRRNGKRYVEGEISIADPIEDGAEFVTFRVLMEPRGFPRLPECLIEGLDRAQILVAAEMHRIESTGPFHLP